MSLQHPERPQDVGSASRNPAGADALLGAPVGTSGATDLCTGELTPGGARARILAWLASGAREVTWALCSLSRERWAAPPPPRLGEWSVLRHARHLALRETRVTLPVVRHALGDTTAEGPSTAAELEQIDAAWDAAEAIETAEAIVRSLGETRFELLQRLEGAPDDAWERPLSAAGVPDAAGFPIQLEWLMLHARQHELKHLAAIWRVVLYWDRVVPATVAAAERSDQDHRAGGLPLHPADRLEESH